MSSQRVLLVIVAVALALSASADLRGTNVCGTYTANQTWTTAGSPYIATCDISISGGATLTINAGVQVRFNQNTGLFIGNGSTGGLSAVGTSTQRISFTANTASPTAGYWQGIVFHGQTTSASQVKFADVFHGGGGGFNHGGIHVLDITGAYPVIQNLKAENNAYAGIRVQGGSPPISSSSIRYNPIGIEVGFGIQASAPSITSTTISNNTGFALNIEANVTLGTVSGLTISGNGTNGASTQGTVTVNTTWKKLGTNIPYVLSAGDVFVNNASSPTLTIPAGSTVKFGPTRQLIIGQYGPGRLQAIGTASQSIAFTANTASPTPGYWRYIVFHPQALTTSKIAYATVSYAEKGVYFWESGATLDHVTFSSSLAAGVARVNFSNAVLPTITNCNFSSNPVAVSNESPATPIDARFNWWNDPSGPSGAGPGTGQSVAPGVKFEPWLGAAASSPRYFTTSSLGNSTFNPQIGINANFSFVSTPSGSGSWTLRVYNGSSVLVRTITGTGVSGSPIWDGKNDSAVLQPNGLYTYTIDCTAGGSTASPLRGRVTLDTTLQFAVNNLTALPAFFSPNTDAIQDTTTLRGVSTFDGAAWTINVRNPGGSTVRTATGAATPNLAYTWDGKNGSGVVQPDGVYTLQLVVTDGSQSVSLTPTVTVDKTTPVATISSPIGPILSNINQGGSADVTVSGTSTDANLAGWTLDYGTGTNPSTWTNVATGSTPVSGASFGTWATLALTNGQFTLRLISTDKAGNTATATRTLSIGNFNITGGSQPLNPAAGGSITFTSIVPNLAPTTVSETLVIKNAAGQIVKTLWSGTRNSGSYGDQWDGKNSQNLYVPAGVYRAVATVTAGASSMTWDPPPATISDTTPQIFGAFTWWNPLPDFWPFNNQPLKFTYTIPLLTPPRPTRSWLLFTPDAGSVWFANMAKISMCTLPGNFCVPAGIYQQSGTHTIRWLGFDPTRTMRTDIQAIVLMVTAESSDGNIIQVLGSEPVVSNLQVTPSYFRPGLGSLEISLNVGTFQSSSLTGTVTIERSELAGAVKSITIPSQPAGAITIQWDGRSDGGFLVAEGSYLVTVNITDTLGSVAKEQALMTIAY